MRHWLCILLWCVLAAAAAGEEEMEIVRPLRPPDTFSPHGGAILTDDSQFEIIARDPTAPLFAGEGRETYLYPPQTSLVDLLEQTKARGLGRFMVSYDFFFGGKQRRLHLDSPETLAAFEVIAREAGKRGLTLEGSIINPLDLGRGYAARYREAGEICQFQEGKIGEGGRYDLTLESQVQWCNNKGPIPLEVKAVRVYAFREQPVPGTEYFAVDPTAMVDVTTSITQAGPTGEVYGPENGWRRQSYRVQGQVQAPGGRNRVLVVLIHRLPDLDYFAPRAAAYAREVIDAYHRRGIDFAAFYGDEMHSQFDWDLGRVGRKELQVRYLTPSMAAAFARRYGREFADLYRYLIYFAQGHGCLEGEQEIDGVQHVLGAERSAIAKTWLLRRNYFDMLSEAVVGLSLQAKRYAERLYSRPVQVTAHPTWQEAPTCDDFGQCSFRAQASSYDYTDAFAGSSSVREAISACYDYFRWNRVYTGCGTDHPEGGWADRNYYARAFACGMGTLNDAGWCYCAAWGGPQEIIRRMNLVTAAYGCRGSHWLHNTLQGEMHRDTAVLLLYPLDLLYADQRFGSWLVQYGYCNYATEEDLCRWGRVTADGRISLRGRRYRVLGALFEPLVRPRTLSLIRQMLERGGRVLWMTTPPERYEAAPDRGSPLADWQRLFGVRFDRPVAGGVPAGGRTVTFAGALQGMDPMTIPSSLLPDWVYPAQAEGSQVVARVGTRVVGTLKEHPAGGKAMFLGFRARDDQAQASGSDIRTLFQALSALGAYPGPDNPERLSRTGDLLANKFPNGVVSVTNHFRNLREQWPGGFKRDPEEDAKLLATLTLPPDTLDLRGLKLDGHTLDYRGREMLSYAVDAGGRLTAFAGSDTEGITVDGREWRFADSLRTLAWAPVARAELAPGVRRAWRLWVGTPGEVRLPITGARNLHAALAEGTKAGAKVALRAEGDAVVVTLAPGQEGKWVWVWG